MCDFLRHNADNKRKIGIARIAAQQFYPAALPSLAAATRKIFFLGAILALCQCGGGKNEKAASDGGTEVEPLNPGPGELALRVREAHVFKELGSDKKWARTYVFLTITLANGADAPDVPANYALFSVGNNLGLSKKASLGVHLSSDNSSETFLEEDECDPSVSIRGGASLTCAIGVVFDGDVVPTDLTYLTPGALALSNGSASAGADTRKATDRIDAQPCTDCGSICTDLRVDPHNCGACKKVINYSYSSSSHPAICKDSAPACKKEEETFCPSGDSVLSGACVDLKKDMYNCGACGVKKLDDDNCGACNASCKQFANSTCSADSSYNYSCIASMASVVNQSCETTCKNSGYDSCQKVIGSSSSSSYYYYCSEVLQKTGFTCACRGIPVSQ